MRYQLDDSVRLIQGVGPAVSEHLRLMGILTIADLLGWYPRRYIDGSNPVPVASAEVGVEQAFRLTIEDVKEGYTRKRGMRSLTAVCSDESGSVHVMWYNQPYLKQKLQPGSTWIMIGSLAPVYRGQRMINAPQLEARPVIIPVYRQSGNISSRFIRSLIAKCLGETLVEESLPDQIRESHDLQQTKTALRYVHQPTTQEEIEQGHNTLAFEEVWEFFLGIEQNMAVVQEQQGVRIPSDVSFYEKVKQTLPFVLTTGQDVAIQQCLTDMAKGVPMTRLLNGDVGSGKTAVAGVLATMVAKAGYKTVFLAPTEILAEQHFKSLQSLLQHTGARVGLWTANHQEVETATADIIVGTHALLYDKISLAPLGLLIVDEQHRFGVQQRSLLREKSEKPPHLLSMTATPIPRTLALTLFADLQVSSLKERPAGRIPVKTFLIDNEPYQRRMYEKIAEEVAVGNQVFVVCPAIREKIVEEDVEVELTLFDEDMQKGKRAAEEEAVRLQKLFPTLRVGLVHGKLKPAAKAAVMEAMNAGTIDILVATSVVEVGVDIANASVMVIEGAESFGLAQLHQLRGRVGRGSAQSFCFLCPHKMSQKIRERLNVLVNSSDGFVIAEADLALRGPGDIQGLSQSGLPDFRMASLTDLEFLQRVRTAVQVYRKDFPGKKVRISKRLAHPDIQKLE